MYLEDDEAIAFVPCVFIFFFGSGCICSSCGALVYIQGSMREINQDPSFKLVQILQILRTTQASNKNLYIIILAITRINVLLIN
jgi:hypothetical protein